MLAVLPNPRKSFSSCDAIFLNNRGLLLPEPILQQGSIYILVAFILAIVAVIFLAKWAKKRHDLTGEEFPLFRVSLTLIVVAPLLTYFALGQPIDAEYPVLKGFNFKGGLSIIPELLALAFALSIYTATYIAEAVRAGMNPFLAVKKKRLKR